MVGGDVMIAVGAGLYIGAGLGTGPRDGLMTGLVAKGLPLRTVRTVMELVVLALGWVLGGTVGVGTVLFACTIGPILHEVLRNGPTAGSSSPRQRRRSGHGHVGSLRGRLVSSGAS